MNLSVVLMRLYARQVGHTEQSIRGFTTDWAKLVQPVIDSGVVHPDAESNWAAFSLLVYYLEGDGIILPLCSKLWIAAIRLFIAIAGTNCPPRVLANEPPFWTGIMGGDFRPNLSRFSESEVSEVRCFLSDIIEKFDGVSVSEVREMISEGLVPEFPLECGFVRTLCDSIVRWEAEADDVGSAGDQQSNLLTALRESGKYTEEDLTDSFVKARNSSCVQQFDLLFGAMTSTRGNSGYRLNIEECAGLFFRPRERSRFPDLDPFGATPPNPVVFNLGKVFPGRLHQAPWISNDAGSMKPPDPLKLWIARNWVNPLCPVWLMTVPAVERIVEAIGLVAESGSHRSTIRQASRPMTSLQRNGKRSKDLPIKAVSLSSEMMRVIAMSGGDPNFGRAHPGSITVGRDIFPFLREVVRRPWSHTPFSVRTD